jgi:hypothetical protein
LRADDRAKTYEVERRNGAMWRRVANFQTEVANCKDLVKPAPPAAPAADPVPPPGGNP